jgi:antiviral defense system Shedu protein SduA
MNQMLDQKNEFQKDIARLKENSHIYDIESYAVHGVLVVGTTPADRDQQKSFELFRGNSKDITIITFNELLGKLKSLQEFLSSDAPAAR